MMLTAFLPCRLGSQRVPNKNIRDFAGIEGGLLKIKLEQLCKTKELDRIVVSSNDPRVLEFASKFCDNRISIDERSDELGSNKTTTDQLIKYVPTIIGEGHVIWTHVTSPFLNEIDYKTIINTYYECLELGYDSLMTVLKIQGFIWNKKEAINYNRNILKWPMTQDIEPVYEVDSGAFLTSIDNYKKFGDRIGINTFLFEQEKNKSIDIDWPEDFKMAEQIWRVKGQNL
ncbi:acylneuraminate cytidylyltransferase family protein [Vibrio parahaemolyticus]|nr:acylneuraminate cytidylyltransferase family protein [Vibrio parahaemolyticus]HCE2247249.1 acylneuraminate cytidylyltransferase family protein [Vibrio parahaemolyticus]